MRTVRATQGPFQQRPHFSPREIENMCADALRETNLLPSEPGPIRIERFIEKRFQVVPRYEELPAGVLGFTEFGAGGVEAVIVSKSFETADAPAAVERRLRTTLAHEAGHGLMHAYLFALGEKPRGLFDDGNSAPSIMCRDVQGVAASARGYDGRWWEYQANRAIGALLLPQSLVSRAAASFLIERGTLGEAFLPPERREPAVQRLAEIFDVNPAVARIRLNEMFDPKTDQQLSL